ncbi:MAG: PD-(D/E)XK nuclease family protein [Oscillospiraceae bacterium]|nr:PD-(D/E)XK nuclease family protein [Oscillospiraceae bacterium]
MLSILLGRAGSGKSRRILERIRALGDDSAQILLVPEHASHVAEIDVCRACGDTASRHAEVLTFKLLASRVLSRVGGAAEVTLDNGGKILLLQRTLQQLAPALHVYRRPSQRTAFLKDLLAVMDELSAYAVEPELLAEKAENISGESGDRLRDIAMIYGVYLAKLHEDGRDGRDRLEKLEENLAASGYVDNKDIFLDGFSYFTGRERNILRIMLRRAKSVTVTLLGDGSGSELFRESIRVKEQLQLLAAEAGVRCEVLQLTKAAPCDALSHLEENFFDGSDRWSGENEQIHLLEAPGAAAEAEWVAAEILRLVREEGYRFRDITLTARDLDSRRALIESTFSRYGIPLYASRRSDILEKNVLTLLLGALDAVTGGFEYDDVFRCLKTGLAGLHAEEVDLLENYVIKWDIRGAMWLHDTPWTAHPEGYGADWREEDTARLAAVNSLRERVAESFRTLAAGIRGTGETRGKVEALYAWMEKIDLPAALEERTAELFAAGEPQRAEELAQLWNILCDVLDQFVSILGDAELDAEEFAHLMRLVLSQYSVGTIPVALDRVNCSEMTRNDRHSVRCLFLLGANDNVLPSVTASGGILKDEDRMALEEQEIRLAPYGMAQFRFEMQNIYAALAQPTEKLYVSYPAFDAAGAQLRPSFVVGRIGALIENAAIERVGDENRFCALKPALEYAAEHIGGSVWEYFAADPAYSGILKNVENAASYTRGSLAPEAVRALYGERITLSASRMDKARSCHFAYFMQYGLKAKERTTAGFDAPQIGTFVHDVMEHTLRAASEEGGVKALDKTRLHTLVRRAIEDYVDKNLPDLPEKTARFRYLFRRLCDSVYRMMDTTVEELRNSDFEPLAFELAFGPGGQLPAVSIREAGEELRVAGKVDRVDGWVKDGKLYLRVIDYKTGSKRLDLAQLRYGLGIQMLLYLFALAQQGEGLFGMPIEPAGVLYVPAREKILAEPRSITNAELEQIVKKNLRRSGMLLAEPEVLCAMEHSALEEPCYLPVAVKRDKSGDVHLSGDLASAAQLGKLGLYVEEQLRRLAREMAEGNIDADPWANSAQESACTYCEFASACHFEDGCGGDRLQYLQPTNTEAFWRHVDATVEKRGGEKHG